MRIRRIAGLLLASSIFAPVACTGSFKESLKALKPPDTANPQDENDSEWDFVGDEARLHRQIETDPDPWWKAYFMSEKARSIEHSLGVD